ncbi:MAG: Sodium-dependent phosphate transporter, partial [uncultured Gemmatimonadetes bacterium]
DTRFAALDLGGGVRFRCGRGCISPFGAVFRGRAARRVRHRAGRRGRARPLPVRRHPAGGRAAAGGGRPHEAVPGAMHHQPLRRGGHGHGGHHAARFLLGHHHHGDRAGGRGGAGLHPLAGRDPGGEHRDHDLQPDHRAGRGPLRPVRARGGAAPHHGWGKPRAEAGGAGDPGDRTRILRPGRDGPGRGAAQGAAVVHRLDGPPGESAAGGGRRRAGHHHRPILQRHAGHRDHAGGPGPAHPAGRDRADAGRGDRHLRGHPPRLHREVARRAASRDVPPDVQRHHGRHRAAAHPRDRGAGAARDPRRRRGALRGQRARALQRGGGAGGAPVPPPDRPRAPPPDPRRAQRGKAGSEAGAAHERI